jgi:hypothetical protein
MAEVIKVKHCYCQKYGDLDMKLCKKSPYNDDDWDELEDPCVNCGWRASIELEMHSFKVKCKKDHSYKVKVGEMVEAYVRNDMLIVNGYITSIDEFKEYFEI